jgi:hypothetical protein
VQSSLVLGLLLALGLVPWSLVLGFLVLGFLVPWCLVLWRLGP